MNRATTPPIGELLVRNGVITKDQLGIAIIEQRGHDRPLGKLLVDLGFVTERALRDALGEALEQRSVDLATTLPDPDVLRLVPFEVAKRYNVLPVACTPDRQLSLAMSDTFDVVAMDRVGAALGGRYAIEPVLAGDTEIAHAIDRFYGFELSIDGILHEIETGVADPALPQSGNAEYSHPLVRLVDALIADAVKRDASDVHFEPEARFLRLRYRIDGVLREVRSLHAKFWPAIVVRLKVMANMDIAETRAPQDGRMQLSLCGRTVDFRTSTFRTLHGENVVLRVLDRQRGIIPMADLGLAEEALASLQRMIARPEGIILVTGPTGSGKTTTLYSILGAINAETRNIMTLEDPVEYPVAGIRQASVNEAARLSFANGIRAMMRQDPDVILVGEIRDADTAAMALRAAMTGHQVYSTLHTNSALGAIPRLLDLGLQADLLAGNIIGIVAQRLVRRLCVRCRQPYEPSESERRLLDAHDLDLRIWRPHGCEACDGQGYKGRLALMEVLRIDREMDERIARRAPLRELREAADGKGFRTLAGDGIRRVLEGLTSLGEVARVVDLSERLE